MQKHLPISAWAEEDRPREKLISKGRHSLSNAELLALIIGSGSAGISAIDLARSILSNYGNDLDRIGGLNYHELQQHKGIGPAKAVNIIACFELSKRIKPSTMGKRPRMRSSRDIFEYIYAELGQLDHESFWVVLLNRANQVIEKINISKGGMTGTVADPKIIFQHALRHQAVSIILCHNHPSGQLEPSEADRQLTQKLVEAARLLDMAVLDHLIIGHNAYVSFADEGWLTH